MNDPVYLSVILPTYNDHAVLAQRLPTLLKHLDTLGASYEIIVVDDGSREPERAREVAESLSVRFEANPVNMGKGAAVRRGMLAAKGRFRIFTDADVPYELDSIDRCLFFLDVRRFDVVAGDRNLPGSSYLEHIPFSRQIGSQVCSFVVGRFLTGGWFDTQCGFKGFRGEAADDLFSVAKIDGFAFDIELIYVALHRNYDMKRMPVRLSYQGGSTVNVLRDGAKLLVDLAKIRGYQATGAYEPKRTPVREWSCPEGWRPELPGRALMHPGSNGRTQHQKGHA